MEYIDIKYNELSDRALGQLEKGVFLTTKVGNKVNTMTIAWGGLNFVWNKSIFIVYVRYSRETYNMIETANEFTVSIPLIKDLSKELTYCGTESGRDYDKIKECNLKLMNSRKINTPILADCELHFECKIIYKHPLEPSSILDTIKNKHYKNDDFHVVYYGEIVDSYKLKGEK